MYMYIGDVLLVRRALIGERRFGCLWRQAEIQGQRSRQNGSPEIIQYFTYSAACLTYHSMRQGNRKTK